MDGAAFGYLCSLRSKNISKRFSNPAQGKRLVKPQCMRIEVKLTLLPGQDSNLRPIDYTYSCVTAWRGLYHHRLYFYTTVQGASNVLPHPTPVRDSLWTFNWISPKAWLLIALTYVVGVPAIHLVCNIDFSIRLLF
jgi:hypothetical protein